MSKRSMINLGLVVATVLLFVITLKIGLSRGEFVGTDSAANDQIAKSAPDYKPWFEGFWTQPGGEVESGLFALQAALGAGLLGFVLGTYRERRKAAKRTEAAPLKADASDSSV